MLVRAYGDTDPRIQEEVLRRSVPLAKQLDVQVTTACYSFKVLVILYMWDSLMDLGCILHLLHALSAGFFAYHQFKFINA